MAGVLLGRRELLEHEHEGVVADDGVLVLQVVEQAQPLGRQVLADHGHVELRAALAAHGDRPRIAIVAGGIRPAAGLGQQGLPLVPGQAAIVPVGASMLTPVVEEPVVVVLVLKRHDLRLDEPVELGEIVDEMLGQIEIHVRFLAGDVMFPGRIGLWSREAMVTLGQGRRPPPVRPPPAPRWRRSTRCWTGLRRGCG